MASAVPHQAYVLDSFTGCGKLNAEGREGRYGLYRLRENSLCLKGTAFRPYITAV
jgi:hypothetical protein